MTVKSVKDEAWRKQKLIECHSIAKERGGKCLSKAFVDYDKSVLWRCGDKEKHEWVATFRNVHYKKSWCPTCAARKRALAWKGDLEKYVTLAAARNLTFLSKEFLGVKIHHDWRCNECLHEWPASPTSISSGSGCPDCGNKRQGDKKRKSIDDAHAAAKFKGGKCLSMIYKTIHEKLIWQCGKCDFIWEASYGNINRSEKCWCPACEGKIIAGEKLISLPQSKANCNVAA